MPLSFAMSAVAYEQLFGRCAPMKWVCLMANMTVPGSGLHDRQALCAGVIQAYSGLRL